MGIWTKSLFFVLTGLSAVVVGCQRLNHESTITVAPLEVQSLLIDAPRGEQKVTVEISSSVAPVDVYVVLEDNREGVKDSLLGSRKPDATKILAGKEKMDRGMLETTVPTGKKFAVMIAGAKKKTEVKVKVKGE